jgi:HKD family nuclease
MFCEQPRIHKFVPILTEGLESGDWRRVEIAVAWVRRSGMRLLNRSLQKFLQSGGVVQITVGVDIENTSFEGLSDLLGLAAHGQIETFIHHNEDREVVFHPKVYLFRNKTAARLIVGSNNLTRAGLYMNTEAALVLDTPLGDPAVSEARSALADWRDTATGIVRRLDDALLGDLTKFGYVLSEAQLRLRRRNSEEPREKVARQTAHRLFQAKRVGRPPTPKGHAAATGTPGTILLMRVRRASATQRRTQVQVPIRLLKTSDFFRNGRQITSAADGRTHSFRDAEGPERLNTIKLEVPEIANMVDPVIRLRRTRAGIIYEAYDSESELGTPIRRNLEQGFRLRETEQSISDRKRATWWRFI